MSFSLDKKLHEGRDWPPPPPRELPSIVTANIY